MPATDIDGEEAKRILSDILDVLEDNTTVTLPGASELSTPDNWCMFCNAAERQPRIPAHKPDCILMNALKRTGRRAM